MARKGWYEALASALNHTKEPIMQLATVDTSGTPSVRSHVWRAFITARTLPGLPLLLTTTDIRTPKVAQMVSAPVVEVVFWTPTSREQFRIRGRVWAVPAPSYGGAYPAPRGVVYEALNEEGFDWEAKRLEVFDGIDERLKASWCRPAPGTPLEGGEEEMNKWPTRLPKLGEAESEDKRNLATALSNFALILVEPLEVDYIELGMFPERRRRFERDEETIDFEETVLVP